MKCTMGLRVLIAGQKYFGEQVLRMCLSNGFEIVAVSCPAGDKHIGKLAARHEIPIIPAGSLNGDSCPLCDIGITAHSFDYIGKRTRYRPKLGWIGYHPSLLPRHRGRSSIEWAVRMGDAVTGGTVYWLNSGVDRGDIICQDWCFIDPALRLKPREAAAIIWRDSLCDMGVRLLQLALSDISKGKLTRQPQDERFATFEPSTQPQSIFKPDLLMLNQYN